MRVDGGNLGVTAGEFMRNMYHRFWELSRRLLFAAAYAVLLASLLAVTSRAADPSAAKAPNKVATGSKHSAVNSPAARAMPGWNEVDTLIKGFFAKQSEYRSGDLISRGQVQTLFTQLAKAGWTPTDRDVVLSAVCGDGDFLVKQLRGKDGAKFMRKIAATPGGYERLDRLAETEGGNRAVSDIIKLPNGPDVLAALAQSRAGRDISRRLGEGPRTSNFDKPTGKIYTEAELVERLAASYQRDAARDQPAGRSK